MSYLEKEFNSLIGKTILSVEFSEDTLRFNLKGDAVTFDAYGDCCSRSYIEDLDNPEIFENATFESVEIVRGEKKEVSEDYVYKWTFYKFKTNKGMCTLSFRNESNGYYNGYLELIK